METRPEPNESLLDEFRRQTRCECCGETTPRCEAHHLTHKGNCRLDVRENLIGLKPEHHYSHHYSGKPSRDELLEIVAKREGKTSSEIRALICRLRQLPKVAKIKPRKPPKPKEWRGAKCLVCDKTMAGGGIRTREGRVHRKCFMKKRGA